MRRLALALLLMLAGCGGGSNGSGTAPIGGTVPTTPSPSPITGGLLPVPATAALTVADVNTVLARAVAEAQARNTPAVIAVTDRVGNVLAVYTMTGARATATLRPGTTMQHRPPGRGRPGRGGGDRQGDHRRLSVVGRQRLLDADGERNRPARVPAVGEHAGTRERAAVRRPVLAAAVLRPFPALHRQRRRSRRGDRPQALAARPRRRSRRLPAVQERYAGRRRRRHGRR